MEKEAIRVGNMEKARESDRRCRERLEGMDK